MRITNVMAVHVAVWYLHEPSRGYRIISLGPTYVPLSYLEPSGLTYGFMRAKGDRTLGMKSGLPNRPPPYYLPKVPREFSLFVAN